jgi:hypothetical protein
MSLKSPLQMSILHSIPIGWGLLLIALGISAMAYLLVTGRTEVWAGERPVLRDDALEELAEDPLLNLLPQMG